MTPTKSHRRCSGGQDVYNVAWASLPDYGIDLRPDWSRLLVWFIPAACSTWIMLLSMAIVLHHRPLVRPTGEAIRVVVIEPTVPPVIPSAAAPPPQRARGPATERHPADVDRAGYESQLSDRDARAAGAPIAIHRRRGLSNERA